jgi:hypothetical protein
MLRAWVFCRRGRVAVPFAGARWSRSAFHLLGPVQAYSWFLESAGVGLPGAGVLVGGGPGVGVFVGGSPA